MLTPGANTTHFSLKKMAALKNWKIPDFSTKDNCL